MAHALRHPETARFITCGRLAPLLAILLIASSAVPAADPADSVTPALPDARGVASRFHGSPAYTFKRIVYVCDASAKSGPMLEFTRTELRKAVAKLAVVQSFNVIFIQGDQYAAFAPDDLVPSTAENKQRALDFFENVTPKGERNALPALKAAFKQKPQLIYLLIDGEAAPDHEMFVAYCREQAREGKTKIMILLRYDDAQPEGTWVDALKQIADDSGGKFKAIDVTPEREEPPQTRPTTAPAKDARLLSAPGDLTVMGPRRAGGAPAGDTILFAPPGDARRIAYVCDASGSTTVLFDDLRADLRRAIAKLDAGRSFNVFFFHNNESHALDPKGLLPANESNRKRAHEFVDEMAPRGMGNPLPALEAAFKQLFRPFGAEAKKEWEGTGILSQGSRPGL